MKPAIRCAIYTRKSTDEGLDREFNSLDAQRESADAYISSQKHEGWIALPDRYDDGGYSGGSMDRPALRRLLSDIEAGKVDVVLVYKVDRLSRSLLDFARLMETFDRHKAAFVSVTQQFNSSTSMGKLTLNVLLSFAQFEREVISERTRDKMRAARRKGKWTGGPPVLGYDIDPEGGRIYVNPAEAERVREIFSLYAERQSLAEVVEELRQRGWSSKAWTTRRGRTRPGTPYVRSTLYRLLSHRAYRGEVFFQGLVYAGEHEAIVTAELWDQVQRVLARNGRSGGRAVRNRYGALLLGLLHCGPCDATMKHSTAVKGSRRYRYYLCPGEGCSHRSLPAGEIERFVVSRLRGIGSDPKILASVPSDAAMTLRRFDPVWEALGPREQARVVQLLVERVVHDGVQESIAVTFRPSAITTWAEEHAT